MAMRCPTCHKETLGTDKLYRPFCSERCKLIDLDNWLSGRYRIPVPIENPEGTGDPEETEEDDKGERG